MKKLIVVRHGESRLNAALESKIEQECRNNPFIERNVSLTEKGIAQARQAGKYLSQEFSLDLCFCSPFARAEETLGYILEQYSQQPTIFQDSRLSEKKFGKFYGMSAPVVKDKFPDEFALHERLGKYWYRPPEGENYEDVRARVKEFTNDLLRYQSAETALVVTHQIPYKMFYREATGCSAKEVEQLGFTPNCAIQVIDLMENKRKQVEKYDLLAVLRS